MSDGVKLFVEEVAESVFQRVMEKIQAQSAQAPRLLTVAQAAKHMGRSPKAIYNLVAKGLLPVVRDGKRVHLDRRMLDEWISQRSQ